MEKKLDMVLGGVELLVSLGVSTLVGSALVLIRPKNLGAIRNMAVGLGGLAISWMAVDVVTNYVDKQITTTVKQFKEAFKKKPDQKETEIEIEVGP